MDAENSALKERKENLQTQLNVNVNLNTNVTESTTLEIRGDFIKTN